MTAKNILYQSSLTSLIITKHTLFADRNDESLSHFHGNYQIIVSLDNPIEYFVSSNTLKLEKNSAIFFNKEQIHSSRPLAAEASYLCVSFENDVYHPQIFKTLINQSLSLDTFTLKTQVLNVKLIHKLRAILQKTDDPFIDWQLLNLISTITLEFVSNLPKSEDYLSPSNDHKEKIFKRLLNFIHQNYAKKIVIDDLVNYALINKNSCNEIFNYFTNETPMQYINKYRLTKAKELIITTEIPITEISERVGFSDSSYFIKKFKGYYSLSPLQYRKKFPHIDLL